jgi:serine phosphatase RsbU (regulator of sigma subunit)
VSVAPGEAVDAFESLRDVPRSTSGFVAVPLLTDRACTGVMAVGVNETLGRHDIEFFEAVAAQVAQTVLRVRLSERESRRRTEVEFLANLTGIALGAADHVELMQSVCDAAVPTLGDWSVLYYLTPAGGPPVVAAAHVDSAKAALFDALRKRYPYDPQRPSGAAAVIRNGRTEFVPEVTRQVIDQAVKSTGLTAEEAAPILDAFKATSAITVPLLARRGAVGAMQFVTTEARRRYDEDDVALAEAVAGRVAEALDATWLADQHRSIAVTLQQALLPPALPVIPGVDLAARYWPAGANRVGGDFYDVFALRGQRWALVIGDVCGTGADAAALTSIARHTIRAAARHDIGPAQVIDWLNEAVLHSNRHLFCTACYAVLNADNDGWHLSSPAAGHPLPIVATADRPHAIGRPGTLLGVFDHVSTTTLSVALHPGDVALLYTDGLTDLPSPYGITPDELADLVHQLRDTPTADQIADALRHSLLQRVPDQTRHDDVALVVLKIG